MQSARKSRKLFYVLIASLNKRNRNIWESISIFITIVIITNFQLSICLPVQLLDQQQQQQQLTATIQQVRGCNTTYYDDNLNPIQPIQPNNNLSQQISIGFECQYIIGEQLHEQFNRVNPNHFKVVSLVVKDSNLTTLSNLPQGTHELKKMVLSNTSIDLEVLKEGSESLNQLTILEIKNEKISNIPQNFFQEMYALKELRLENDDIASLDGDAFHNLDDSLEILDLKNNHFNRFPMAIRNLAQLTELDLTDNDIFIDTQDNDLPEKLELLLNLQKLSMNRINCTCEFSSSPFFEWIARTHMTGVRCSEPENLYNKEVIVFGRDEFCTKSSANQSVKTIINDKNYLLILICQFISYFNLLIIKRYYH